MFWGLTDESFINRWRNTDFSSWNESDIREDFIAPLLASLGYSKRTVHNIIREKHLELNTPFHRIGRKRVSIDYVPTIRLKSFWIIEAKPGSDREMSEGDLLQAHLYATHPEMQVPLIVLCNGWSIKIYDAYEIEDWNKPLIHINQDNCEQCIHQLRGTLSVHSILEYQRNRILKNIENTFSAEIDLDQCRNFKREVYKIMNRCEKLVKENDKELQHKSWKLREQKHKDRVNKSEISQLIIQMDIPISRDQVAAKEIISRIENDNSEGQFKILNELWKFYLQRPHEIYRVNFVFILMGLIRLNIEIEGVGNFKSIKELAEYVLYQNVTYFESNNILNALCHLDNTCYRVAYKYVKNCFMDIAESEVEKQKAVMSVEDRIRHNPNVVDTLIRFIGITSEKFWRYFRSENDVNSIWNGIWSLELLEELIDKLPVKDYPKGEGDILFFKSFGRGYDSLYMIAWTFLNGRTNDLIDWKFRDELIKISKLSIEEAISNIPYSRTKPIDFRMNPNSVCKLNNDFRIVKSFIA